MNLGLGNLKELKGQLLAPALQTQGSYDAVIASIGSGVAKHFEDLCNRRFGRVVGDTCQFSAACDHYYVPRYPIENVATVEQRDSMSSGWMPLNSIVWNQNESTGLISFGGQLGYGQSQVRVTYTGGYWFDGSENGSEVKPAGATALPESLKLAWFLTCRKVWEALDKTGVGILKSGASGQFVTGTLGDLKLVPQVKAILDGFVRYQITA